MQPVIFHIVLLSFVFFFQDVYPSHPLLERVESNIAISSTEKKACLPFLMRDNHPIKPILDKLFQDRVVFNLETFLKAGFKIISDLPEKKIIVATHPELGGFVVKVFLDSVPVNKSGDPNWKWLYRRAFLASQIRKFIKNNNINRFRGVHKWLYPLPNNQKEGNDNHWVLVAEKMPLRSPLDCLEFWKTKVKVQDLKELYKIMKYCGGQSYRPDNIPITVDGRFVFIDTEYPHLPPIYKEILPYLSDEMGSFWKLHVLSHELSQNSSIDSLARKRKKI